MNVLESYHGLGSSNTSLCNHLIHPLLFWEHQRSGQRSSKEATKELAGAESSLRESHWSASMVIIKCGLIKVIVKLLMLMLHHDLVKLVAPCIVKRALMS